jgi:hypothetical protein
MRTFLKKSAENNDFLLQLLHMEAFLGENIVGPFLVILLLLEARKENSAMTN